MYLDGTKRLLKAILPDRVRIIYNGVVNRTRKTLRKFHRRPPVGWVRFGSLKRLDPVDRDFGWRWGKVIDRYYIEEFLQECAGDVGGNVLEVADNTYTVRFGGAKVTRSDVLHRKPGNPKATIVADLTQAEQIPSNRFDCIILTQTLQFVYCMQAAVRTLYRILKPGGVLLVSCHGISQISPVDMELWGEYWRFTSLSLHKLLNEAFPENQIAVKAYGNVHTAAAFLYGLNAGDLRPEALKYQDPNYEVVLCARVVKPKSQEANK